MDIVSFLNEKMKDSFVIITITIVLVIVLILSFFSFSLDSGSTSTSEFQSFTTNEGSSNSSSSVMTVIFVVFVLVLIIGISSVLFNGSSDLGAKIRSFFELESNNDNKEPKETEAKESKELETKEKEYKESKQSSSEFKAINPEPVSADKKQVFNVPGNYYTYEDAKAVCSAFGAELASYDQIEKAYNKGAEWCNYGWSANQLALFPTQRKTYDMLQSKQGREHACGRPGINGGYIANPNVKFGANCYGKKPLIRSEEAHIMQTVPPYPETVEEMEFQKKVDAMKKNIDNILVSPFNHNAWDET